MIKVDRTLAKEIKAANGDGGREAKFAFLAKVRGVEKELSNINAREIFDTLFGRYPRAAIAVCVASTIIQREDRLSSRSVEWARSVMSHWTNRPLTLPCINDNLHPSRIEEYAGSFIRLTSE